MVFSDERNTELFFELDEFYADKINSIYVWGGSQIADEWKELFGYG